MMRLPDFFIIGAAKAATTTLSSLLASHPEAGIIRGKEPHFFSVDANYSRGLPDYMRLFSHCSGKKRLGDASTSYSRIRNHPQTARRIHAVVPHARIIYMVRHPLQRIESAFLERMATSARHEPWRSINEAVRMQPTLIDSSRYWEVYSHYRQLFGPERIQIVWYEDFVSDLPAGFRSVCRFLDIGDIEVTKPVAQNSRSDVRNRLATLGRGHWTIDTNWDQDTRNWVKAQLHEDTARFLQHFNKPRDYWTDIP